MKRYQIILSILLPFFLIFFSTFVIKLPQTSSYNHLQLVSTWPNTFCVAKGTPCKIPVPQNFKVHGIWPADKKGTTVTCKAKKEDIDPVLKNYEKQLKKVWPTLRSDITDEVFWKHEWNNHGICAEPTLNVTQYLEKIILWGSKFDLLNALTTSGIKPDNSAYERSKVLEAIEKETNGKQIYISCTKYEATKGTISTLLYEVYICLDPKGEEIISCPPSNKLRGCDLKKDIVFPDKSYPVLPAIIEEDEKCGLNEDFMFSV